ncbi:hypothetical protein TTHERM_01179950 (macronuclear) [Tetrahymena thermophila SB210]|uniref:Tetratricopeptide repeat protein n=1 Tax=Tetrahymena thermophila (strain SB210) TaxID=312017 RepID=Q22AN0_TETTS|nr:hypothetical protein TTHERM_01179950 [Tetrahymena thermophila SB210]EAR82364.1 hypothetical protein TTHERM_01179950 [Tetrahymena thermophila SB210]|eukprot:XP_001030027.1 hypothetical protein TTHERM_01179950 [Tetrahymena thermophila SB210]
MNNNYFDSFSKEANSVVSLSPQLRHVNQDKIEFQKPLTLNKMVSDHIQINKSTQQRGTQNNYQKLMYAKSLNYDPTGQSFSMNENSEIEQGIDFEQKERANRSVILQDLNNSSFQNENDAFSSFHQHSKQEYRRKNGNYAHNKISGQVSNQLSLMSQTKKRSNLKVLLNQNAGLSTNSLSKDNSKSRARKISFAGQMQNNQDEKKSVFQFPPQMPFQSSKPNKVIYLKQNSESLDRTQTASTRPQTTQLGMRQQYFRFGDSKGFLQSPQNNSVEVIMHPNEFSTSFISDKNDFSLNRPSTNNASVRSRFQRKGLRPSAQASQFNSTQSKKHNEIRNQYDLDNTFLSVFHQTQFSNGESSNVTSKYLHQKRADRKSVTSNNSKRGSIGQNYEISINLQNNSPQTASTNNQSILKKRFGRKAFKCEAILDEINCQNQEIQMKIDQIIKDIDEDNFKNTFPHLKELISKAVDINDLKLFCTISEFMADLALEMQDIKSAVFLYDQFRNLSTYTKNYSKKAKSLLQLAKCARQINFYQEAIIILKKALQYAWYSKENDIELEIYDEFGRNYYFQGNIMKAQYYHERFMNCEYEDDQSPTKQFSEENLNTFFKTLQFTFTDVTSLLLAYLKIPILTIEEMPQYGNINQTNYIQGKTPRINVNDCNQLYFDNCDPKELLQKLIIGDEFYIQIQSPKFAVKIDEMELSKLAKKRIDKMMFRQTKAIYEIKKLGKIDLASKLRDFTNPFKYRVPLEKKIDYLKKQKIDVDIDSKLEKVRQSRTQRNEDNIRNRVYNNSLYKNPKNVSQNSNRKPITNNYKNMYKTFIIDYLDKKNDLSLQDIF